MSKPPASATVSYSGPSPAHVQKQYVTSTPKPNHSHIVHSDPLQTSPAGNYQWKTTVTETRTVDGQPRTVTQTAVSQGTLMDKKKVPLPGLGSQLSHDKKR